MREYRPPRVSVLIGCWNNAATLRAAAQSILTQTLSDLELVIVDDGSTDATPQLAAELGRADDRVRYLRAGSHGDLGQPQRGPARRPGAVRRLSGRRRLV